MNGAIWERSGGSSNNARRIWAPAAAAALEAYITLSEDHLPRQADLRDDLAEFFHQRATDSQSVVGDSQFGAVSFPAPFLMSDKTGCGTVIWIDRVVIEDVNQGGEFSRTDALGRVSGAVPVESDAICREHVSDIASVGWVAPSEVGPWLPVGTEHSVGAGQAGAVRDVLADLTSPGPEGIV
jgi:hypothetical protein